MDGLPDFTSVTFIGQGERLSSGLGYSAPGW